MAEIRSTRQDGWFICPAGRALQHYTVDGGHTAICNKRFGARYAPLNDGSGWGFEISAELRDTDICEVCPRCQAKVAELAEIVIKLTEFQADEVSVGMDIDHDDNNPEWGHIERRGKKTYYLHVTNVDRAVYRITSSRDVWQDNANGGDQEYAPGARSLAALTEKLIDAVGGREAVSPEYRRWI